MEKRYLKITYLAIVHFLAVMGLVLFSGLYQPIVDKLIRYHWSAKKYDEEQMAFQSMSREKNETIGKLNDAKIECLDSLKKVMALYRSVQAKFEGTFSLKFNKTKNLSLVRIHENEYRIRRGK